MMLQCYCAIVLQCCSAIVLQCYSAAVLHGSCTIVCLHDVSVLHFTSIADLLTYRATTTTRGPIGPKNLNQKIAEK